MRMFFSQPFTTTKLLILITIGVCLLSFFFALYLLPTQLIFTYDQARDAYEAYSIWSQHHLKILGPPSDVPLLNHGVIWYYFLAVLYFLAQGTPEIAGYLLIISLYLLLPFLAFITYRLTKDTLVTCLTVILYSFSPLFITFTHWLSNPVLALYIAPFLIYLLWRYQKIPAMSVAIVLGLLWGLLIQSDFGFGIMLLLLPLYYLVCKAKLVIKDVVLFGLGLFVGILPLLIAYLKFRTNVFSIVFHFVFSGTGGSFINASLVPHFFTSITKLFSITYLPLPSLIIWGMLIVMIGGYSKLAKKRDTTLLRLLLVWLLGIPLIFLFNHGSLSAIFFYGPFLYPLALLLGILLSKTIAYRPLLFVVVGLLVALQINQTLSWKRTENSPLSVQQGMTINREREVMDYTYTSSAGKPFAIATLTNPLDINTTWSYLYEILGKPKYHSVPFYSGKDQRGYLSFLPAQTDLKEPPLRYVIIEPLAGIDPIWKQRLLEEENKYSRVIEEKQFGNFLVQKRLMK